MCLRGSRGSLGALPVASDAERDGAVGAWIRAQEISGAMGTGKRRRAV